jgi:hypothetical protein
MIMNKMLIVLKFVAQCLLWGLKLGVSLGALIGWGFTGCALLPYGLLYLGVGLVAGLAIGVLCGLFNGVFIGVASLTIFRSLENYDSYNRAVGISAVLLTLISSLIGFYILLDSTLHAGFLAIPAAIVATFAAVYAIPKVTIWYWSLRSVTP